MSFSVVFKSKGEGFYIIKAYFYKFRMIQLLSDVTGASVRLVEELVTSLNGFMPLLAN